ncbi:hypothetical protein TRIP_B50039 [uncultured Desulfatiglans sp.]|uniref:Uncharacterized protein n=1 Tax=Uncultured Desulfatiglans sp. TaxID=1748965 RepID=A0A653AFX7_UNCDX|nr:hypothetical protein TRIP_B50039 [uncultured Desulfatiglans sp.]
MELVDTIPCDRLKEWILVPTNTLRRDDFSGGLPEEGRRPDRHDRLLQGASPRQAGSSTGSAWPKVIQAWAECGSANSPPKAGAKRVTDGH